MPETRIDISGQRECKTWSWSCRLCESKYLWNKSLGFTSLHKMDGVAHQRGGLVAQEHLSDVVQDSDLDVGVLRWCDILNRGHLITSSIQVITCSHRQLLNMQKPLVSEWVREWVYHCEINVQLSHVRAQVFRITFHKFLLGWMQEPSHILWKHSS